MPQIVWITRPDGWNIYFNKQWVDYTGLTLEESYGHGWNKPFHPDDQHRAWDAWQNATKNVATYLQECRLRRADGVFTWWLIRGVPIFDVQGAVLKWFGTCTDINDRKRAEEVQRKITERLSLACHAGGIGIWELDIVNNNLIWDDQMFNLYGITPDKFSGTYEAWRAGVHPEDLQKSEKELQMSIRGEKDFDTEFRIVWPDGTIHTIRALAFLQRDASGQPINIIGTNYKITEFKLAEEELQQSNQKWKAIILSSPDGIGMISVDGKLQLMSDKLAKMFGYSIGEKDEFIGKPSLDFIDPSNHKMMLENIRKLLAGEIDNKITEYLAIKKDNSRFYVELHSTVLFDSNGNPTSILFVERDITARKQAEVIIQQQNNQLQELNATKDKFFSIIAHDLKSPFQGFLGLTQNMAEEASSFSAQELAYFGNSMNQTANNLFALLKNLLEWAQMQKGSMSFQPKELSLSELIVENVEMVKERSRQKSITVINTVTSPVGVYGDGKMIRSVLLNLLSNAVKFTHREGTVTISAKKTEDQMIEISIRDSGVGMPKSMVEKLFELGEKTGRKGTDEELSTGLGLLLCKEFVEKNGGQIWVESAEGKGSIFYFTVPGSNHNNN